METETIWQRIKRDFGEYAREEAALTLYQANCVSSGRVPKPLVPIDEFSDWLRRADRVLAHAG